jgi:type II restriction enzyme
MENLIKKVEEACEYSKDKSNKFGEVFTPTTLINDMLDSLPAEVWSDETKTWLDPCAGKGNFPAVVVSRLMEGLSEKFPNREERYRHIIENQLFMYELQPESCHVIRAIFNPNGDLKLNLVEGSFV